MKSKLGPAIIRALAGSDLDHAAFIVIKIV